MNTLTLPRPARPSPAREEGADPIEVVYDADLAERLQEADRPMSLGPAVTERPAPRRETYQYD